MVIEAMCRILNVLDDDWVRKADRWLSKKVVEIPINSPIISIEKDRLTVSRREFYI